MAKSKNDLGLSLIVPVYKNEENLPDLIKELESLASKIHDFEVVFVIDGSPDNCEVILTDSKADFSFPATVIVHSRNFGSYSAIRTGFEYASKEICAIMAADLQEPLELILKFHKHLQNKDIDIAVGTRTGRNDGWFTDTTSRLFWGLYSALINRDIPAGGVDIFALKSNAKSKLLSLTETDSSMIAQVFWIGFTRVQVPYERRERKIGKSGHTFQKRLQYMSNSILSFTSLPIKAVSFLGMAFLLCSIIYGIYIVNLAINHAIPAPGFATLILVILTGFGLNMICLGVLGAYVWRTFKNTQNRPQSIVKEIK